MGKDNTNHFIFLSPVLTIKKEHLTKRDVRNIKVSLSRKIGVSALVVAFLILLVNIVAFITMSIETKFNQIEVYGITSFLGQMISIVGTICVIVFEIVALKNKYQVIKERFSHLSSLLMFLVMGTYFFLSLYADAAHGFMSTPALSPSVTLISFFILIQPVFWREAIILDGSLSLGLIGFVIFAAYKYNIDGLMYYFLIAISFPIGSYLIISILFYAETQKYCEELRNQALFDHATYDELTHCKNRYMLNTTIENNITEWKNNKEESLVVMMFDIDDFKQYNDQFSHVAGDYCLKTISDGIRKAFPSPSLDFYRYGGEEFLFFIEASNRLQAEYIIEKVRTTVLRLCIVAPNGAPNQYVTISIGGTFVKVDEIKDFEEVIKTADKYLYEAKRNGKNVSVLDGNLISNK